MANEQLELDFLTSEDKDLLIAELTSLTTRQDSIIGDILNHPSYGYTEKRLPTIKEVHLEYERLVYPKLYALQKDSSCLT